MFEVLILLAWLAVQSRHTESVHHTLPVSQAPFRMHVSLSGRIHSSSCKQIKQLGTFQVQ